MSLILGMDIGVFLAWIGTLLAVILCIIYGLYHQFIKNSDEKKKPTVPLQQVLQEEES
ncbi:MAG: hypothetical protein JW840_09100 [Candidatus Thermoplasmatota archaeon]|nr:hypothetical protein [Candidatus Thermoplasmatota archaeon]